MEETSTDPALVGDRLGAPSERQGLRPAPVRDGIAPAGRGLARRIATFGRVALGGRPAPTSVEAFVQRVAARWQEAVAAPTPYGRLVELWEMEALALRFLSRPSSAAVALPRLPVPRGSAPVLHIGLGMAAALATGFDAPAFLSRLHESSDPTLIGFAFDGAGAALAVAEGRWMGLGLACGSLLGATPARPRPPADRAGFLARLSRDELRSLAHGYGRVRYLTGSGLARTVAGAAAAAPLPAASLARGATIAFALVNARDLDRALAVDSAWASSEVARWVDEGLLNARVFLEWCLPGALTGSPGSAAAADSAARARANGDGPPLVI